MAKRPIEPLLWLLFSAGGVLAALLVPVLLFLFGLAFPLGWLSPPELRASAGAPAAIPLTAWRSSLSASLSLFHWAHRFRYTLYDGLQIKHLNEVINLLCYGGAIVGRSWRRTCCCWCSDNRRSDGRPHRYRCLLCRGRGSLLSDHLRGGRAAARRPCASGGLDAHALASPST